MVTSGLVSIVTPVFNEAEGIRVFHRELSNVLEKLAYKFEIVYVDDGSSDDSVAEVERIEPTNNVDVNLVKLSRNFGKEIAVTAGIHEAKGDAVIIIDSDLQHPVEKLPEFLKKWRNGSDVVIGVRKESKKESRIKTFASNTFYKILNTISETEIIPHSTDYRLLDRQVVNEFKRFTERGRMTRGLIDWLGFNRDTVYYHEKERQHGTPSYSYKKLIGLAVASFVSHSLMPLRLAGYIGAIMVVFSGMLAAFVLIEQVIMRDPMGLDVSGTAMITLAVLFVSGIILSCLGLISLYIASIHKESINRPMYVIKRGKK